MIDLNHDGKPDALHLLRRQRRRPAARIGLRSRRQDRRDRVLHERARSPEKIARPTSTASSTPGTSTRAASSHQRDARLGRRRQGRPVVDLGEPRRRSNARSSRRIANGDGKPDPNNVIDVCAAPGSIERGRRRDRRSASPRSGRRRRRHLAAFGFPAEQIAGAAAATARTSRAKRRRRPNEQGRSLRVRAAPAGCASRMRRRMPAARQSGRSRRARRATMGRCGLDDQSRCDYKVDPTRGCRNGWARARCSPTCAASIRWSAQATSMHKCSCAARSTRTSTASRTSYARTTRRARASTKRPTPTTTAASTRGSPFPEVASPKRRSTPTSTARPDVWKFYVGGQLSRIQRDRNHDSRPDRGSSTRRQARARRSRLDFDGHVDRWDHDEIARLAAEAQERGSNQGAKSTSASGVGDGGAAMPTPATGDLSKLGADAGASVSKRKKK